MRKIIMGTRGSVLAVAQAETVKKMLTEKIPGLTIEIKKIVTSGDKDQTTNWGGDSSLKSMFVKEIEKLEDNEFRDKIIAKGLEQSKKFSWDRCFEETFEFYKEVVGKKFS